MEVRGANHTELEFLFLVPGQFQEHLEAQALQEEALTGEPYVKAPLLFTCSSLGNTQMAVILEGWRV